MEIDFTNINYLEGGNIRQRQVYKLLSRLSIMELLGDYYPILVGTIPIGIDIDSSDLDIICDCRDHHKFSESLKLLYSNQSQFKIRIVDINGLSSTIATFEVDGFAIEIFGQECATTKQMAYRHMLIEHKILKSRGRDFRSEIIKLKKGGLKTEPAFAQLLGLKGDPYQSLLKFEI